LGAGQGYSLPFPSGCAHVFEGLSMRFEHVDKSDLRD
jgi:hypothetical protein